MNTDPMIQVTPPSSYRRTTMRVERPRLHVRSAGATDQGRERNANEDRFLIATVPKTAGDAAHLFAVADGVGGARGGAAASALAVESIEELTLPALRRELTRRPPDKARIVEDLSATFRYADARLIDESTRRPELKGMGTTLTMAWSSEREIIVAHAGDSRCYLFRGGALRQLTRDHTVVQELVRRGFLDPKLAPEHRFRHVLTNVLGGHNLGLKVEVYEASPTAGDALLLCTDGLTEMLSDESIASILAETSDPELACTRLIERANDLGGRDNVTAVVARFDVAS